MLRNYKNAKRLAVETWEIRYLRSLMLHHEGNVTKAARAAGLQRTALQKHLARRGIKSAEYRDIEVNKPSATVCGHRGCPLHPGHLSEHQEVKDAE